MVTQIKDARAADAESLAEIFARYTERPVLIRRSLSDAWDYVREHQEGRCIYCVGSLYLAGMLKVMAGTAQSV